MNVVPSRLLLLIFLASRLDGLGLQPVQAQNKPFRFLATGDTPYTAKEEETLRRLLKKSESDDFAFLMHVGDIKGGGAKCTDKSFKNISKLFRKYPKPVVYTPGDNEWTDCHANKDDPIERLAKLRELFFADKRTLRLDQLQAVYQSEEPAFSKYVENYRFTKSGVLFVVAHVVGSNNGRRTNNPPAMKEFHERNLANMKFLDQSFAVARQKQIVATAIVIHANPAFDKKNPAFQGFLATLRKFMTTYKKPVLCIHGDSHKHRIDKPFKSLAGKTYDNFTRMEVFGAPVVAGVAVSVNPNSPTVFRFERYDPPKAK